VETRFSEYAGVDEERGKLLTAVQRIGAGEQDRDNDEEIDVRLLSWLL
jgi:hypothetical protein